jgi:hypothetical protein
MGGDAAPVGRSAGLVSVLLAQAKGRIRASEHEEPPGVPSGPSKVPADDVVADRWVPPEDENRYPRHEVDETSSEGHEQQDDPAGHKAQRSNVQAQNRDTPADPATPSLSPSTSPSTSRTSAKAALSVPSFSPGPGSTALIWPVSVRLDRRRLNFASRSASAFWRGDKLSHVRGSDELRMSGVPDLHPHRSPYACSDSPPCRALRRWRPSPESTHLTRERGYREACRRSSAVTTSRAWVSRAALVRGAITSRVSRCPDGRTNEPGPLAYARVPNRREQ